MPNAINWTKVNRESNKKLKEMYLEEDITTCEIKYDENCWYNNGLQWHHRHKRVWYKSEGRLWLLSTFNHTLLTCPRCHTPMEHDSDLTEAYFIALRGEEIENGT